MGEQVPSESYLGDRLRCCRCDVVLPPCMSFDDLYEDKVYGLDVFIFNRGQYYRPTSHYEYKCANCFHESMRGQQDRRQEEERRRQEEERRRQEQMWRQGEDRRRQEEERRRQEEIWRQEEDRRRQEEERRRQEKERRRQEESREQVPSESYLGDRLRCSRCDVVLPPCMSFDDLYEDKVYGLDVFVFNRGQYYRPTSHYEYKCANCFHESMRGQQDRRQEERRRQEEERRRQEEERRKQEEERRRQEQMWRQEEERRRQEEERRRQEQMWRQEEERRRQEEEWRRQEEERRRKEQSREQVPSESYLGDRLRCSRCDDVLPPCMSFDDLYEDKVYGLDVFVFNRGQYYRPTSHYEYKCANCFHESMRGQQDRRQEEDGERQGKRRPKREAVDWEGEKLNQRLSESIKRAEEQRENELSSAVVSEENKSRRDILKVTMTDANELLEILSIKCNISVRSLSISQLKAEDLDKIVSALDSLLFEEWIDAPPSLSTLQLTNVFLTELCALSLQMSEEEPLQTVSEQVQELVGSVSQSASGVIEHFLLSQALYLTLMHFLTEHSDTDVVLMAKRWAKEELSSEQTLIIEFLSTLLSSLQTVVDRASVFILKMEIKCLKLLLSILTNINTKEPHSEVIEKLLRLVQTNQWTPVEAMTLLTALEKKYTDDKKISKVLSLVQVYELPPGLKDEQGNSLIQVLDSNKSYEDLQKSIRKTDENSLRAALAELQQKWSLDDSVTDRIENITSGVLHSSGHVANDADPVQMSLLKLCTAVFHSKGWWPTVRSMLRWCALVLTENSAGSEPVGVQDDKCATAMFAAEQALKATKVDIVLSSDGQPEERAEEWSNFFESLKLTVDTNTRKSKAERDVYKADVLYGTISDFVSDYVQRGMEVMEKRNIQQSRQFIFEGLTFSTDLELSRLEENDARKVLQRLMGKFHREDEEVRHSFLMALFKVLYSNLNQHSSSDSESLRLSQKITGEVPLPRKFILVSLENLLKEVTKEKNETSPAGGWCLEILLSCVEPSKTPESLKEVFQMVSDLVAQGLWSAVESLNLLAVLTDHHHDDKFTQIQKILHLMLTYQVSSLWSDENGQSLLKLIKTYRTEDFIRHLEKTLRDEKVKSIDTLFDELEEMGDIDEETLRKSKIIVTHVRDLISTGEIKKHTDTRKAKALSLSRKTEDLQQVLAVLCNAVHNNTGPPNKSGDGWWPRDTQMISWCLLALSDTGRLLEMGTGEGKSCVIAMFAALRVLQGDKVDVVSSSSVLCQRDAEEWKKFYEYFEMTVDSNTNKTEDKERKACYQENVVYGTVEAFAADHLRQTFEMKDVRPDRKYQCIIVDEVDSLLLDQGVQLTYLSSPMVSMQHLNIILAMIWGHVSQYGFLSAEHQTFVQSPPASFFKAIFDSIDTEESEIQDPMDILRIAEETGTVKRGFTEEICESKKDELLQKLKTVSQDDMVKFFDKIEDYVPYGFTVYTLDDQGSLSLKKRSPYNNQDIPELTFLVLDEGLCCTLYDSEEHLIKPIADTVKEKVQFTPCTNNKDKINVPGFLRNLVEKKVSVWVQNAFLALQLREGREYVIENDSVSLVDFRSTGVVELNKKWSDGLQQFVEIKHKVKLSAASIVTNYVSNISFFEMYSFDSNRYIWNIYGTTGTLGSNTDIELLKELHRGISTCKIPAFNRKKLFELKGILTDSAEEWKSEIKRVVLEQISSKSYREGRAALVICETINKAKEIHEELRRNIDENSKVILYCRSDNDSLSVTDGELRPGDVIVATNLAGRGTDIKVSDTVNNNGGLFVILSFLSENTRVELQAFGRTARQGKPGSAQIIMCTEHQQQSIRTAFSVDEAKETRDGLAAEKISQMKKDIEELRLREELFIEYCKTLQEIHAITDGNEKKAIVAIMNEFWGTWLQVKSDDIDQLKRNDLIESLKHDLEKAKEQSQRQTSPLSSIYHYIKFGNVTLRQRQWDDSSRLFEKAMDQDESWAAIAFYSHAYCTIMKKEGGYLSKAIDDLKKAQESLKYLCEEFLICLQVVKMSSPSSSDTTSLEKQLLTKQQMLSYLDKNITEAIQMLDTIKAEGRDAIAKKSPVASLVSGADEDLQEEVNNLFRQGLLYVFSVEKEPRFSWGALAVFFLGIAQIIGGVVLTAVTYGTLAQVGMGLIVEGVSDCISTVESMVTGDFSWKSWAIEKSISIGVSLLGFGIGKLVAKGFKASRMLLKGFGKQLKSMPKFLSRQAKEGFSLVTRTNLKNSVKYTGKKMVEELVTHGLGKAEEQILKEILDYIENRVKQGIADDVKSNIEGEKLGSLVDAIIRSHVDDEEQLKDLLGDKDRKSRLLDVFKELSETAVQPFYANLSLQEKLSSVSRVIDKAKGEVKGTAWAILSTIQTAHMASLAVEATAAVSNLSGEFFRNLQEQLRKFMEDKKATRSSQDTERLKEFKEKLVDMISRKLSAALVEVFHQKFSSHLVSWIQSRAHGVVSKHVRSGLKSDRTEQLLRAGQNNSYIRHKPVDLFSKHHPEGEVGERSKSHADKIRDPKTAGTILDIRVLSETTGTKVVIFTEKQGKLTLMQELSPDTKPASQTVALIYKPKSDQYPDGHYDVLINNQRVPVGGEDKSCLYLALAKGRNPSKEDITKEAEELRQKEADALLKHSGQWEPFIKRKEWTEAIRGGHWYTAEGAGIVKFKETKASLKKEVGKIEKYRDWNNYRSKNPGIGQIINADHQPAVSCIAAAGNSNKKSLLAKGMLKVATGSPNPNTMQIQKVKKKHGLELPTVYVPAEVHREFPSTISKKYRELLTKTIENGNVVDTFKLTILGAIPRFRLNPNKGFKMLNAPLSNTRLSVFDASFPQHSEDMVKNWSKLLPKEMTAKDVNTIIAWIKNGGYKKQNDKLRKKVSRLL